MPSPFDITAASNTVTLDNNREGIAAFTVRNNTRRRLHATARLTTQPRHPFTFACAIWKDPWMWCGGDTYVSRLVECAGGTNVLLDQTRYPQLSVEALLALRPEIVFLPDEPYLFTEEDAQQLPAPRVIGPFPGHLFTWHGVRTIEGLRFLREALAR